MQESLTQLSSIQDALSGGWKPLCVPVFNLERAPQASWQSCQQNKLFRFFFSFSKMLNCPSSFCASLQHFLLFCNLLLLESVSQSSPRISEIQLRWLDIRLRHVPHYSGITCPIVCLSHCNTITVIFTSPNSNHVWKIFSHLTFK